MTPRFTALFSALLLLSATAAFAAPTKLYQQGRMLDGDGKPLDGTHAMSFALFDAETDGTQLWLEERIGNFEAGYYSITLGEQVPLDDLLFAAESVWLELSIDGETLAPRQEVVSVPYALRATAAEHVDGGIVDAVEISVDGTVVIDASGNWIGPTPTVGWSALEDIPADIADGDQDEDTLAGLACAEGQLPKWDAASSLWVCGDDIDTDTTDPNTDTLVSLACSTGQVAKWDGTTWACGNDIDTDTTDPNTDTQLTETQVDAFVANGSIEIQVADSADSCDGTNVGKMKTSNGLLFFCNGTSWKIVSLDDPSATLSIAPSSQSGMNLSGGVSPGTTYTFTVTNDGFAASQAIGASLSNATNFELVADNCSAVSLAVGASCTIELRAKAVSDGSMTGTLIITADNSPIATLSGTAAGFGDWVKQINVDGNPYNVAPALSSSQSCSSRCSELGLTCNTPKIQALHAWTSDISSYQTLILTHLELTFSNGSNTGNMYSSGLDPGYFGIGCGGWTWGFSGFSSPLTGCNFTYWSTESPTSGLATCSSSGYNAGQYSGPRLCVCD